jgi:hypothetical protein
MATILNILGLSVGILVWMMSTLNVPNDPKTYLKRTLLLLILPLLVKVQLLVTKSLKGTKRGRIRTRSKDKMRSHQPL